MLTCDMEYLLSQNLVYEDEQHLDLGGIFNACLGLSGEVGEFNDMIKKWVFHGIHTERTNVLQMIKCQMEHREKRDSNHLAIRRV